ncbi:MAG: hypothetical protein RLZZ210_1632 [Pseudomonadota bacterium]
MIDEQNHIDFKELKYKLQQAKILVVGDIMLDRYWFGDTNRISPEAPVPIIKINKFDDRLGGAANVARNLAHLGINVGILGCIGQDEAGLKVQTLLTEECINAYLQTADSYTTILKLRVLARQQQMLRLDFEENLPHELLEKIEYGFEKLISQYDLVILSDYNKGCLRSADKLIQIAKQHNVPVLVDPKDKSLSKYRGASVITPNLKEFEEIAGSWANEEELHIKAQNIREQFNLQSLLLTRSEHGMTLFTASGYEHFNAQAKEVFDVSGAGDTVMAVLAAILSITDDIKLATKYANIAGGIVVGKLGTSTIEFDELCASIAK